jgi:hypothetical protein
VKNLPAPLAAALILLLTGCGGGQPIPMASLDRQLRQDTATRFPSLAGNWLAVIATGAGRERVQLIQLNRGRPVPLPGLNRPDAQPLSVSVDRAGERLAVVRQLQGRTELVLYRRSLASLTPIPMEPAGVPRVAALRADGRELAVEVSRQGQWQVDLIRLP